VASLPHAQRPAVHDCHDAEIPVAFTDCVAGLHDGLCALGTKAKGPSDVNPSPITRRVEGEIARLAHSGEGSVQNLEADLRRIVSENEEFMAMLRTVCLVAPPEWCIAVSSHSSAGDVSTKAHRSKIIF
jgi:hypothetical protein